MRQALSILAAIFVACATAENHARAYDFFPVPYYAGSNEVNPRNLRSTTIVTSTSVSTVTCTKSIATGCTGRRRRAILLDDDSEEQFPIAPSAVEG